MNEWEVLRLCDHAEYESKVSRYARFLRAWVRTVNENSDGWAYWTAGRRAGEKIANLIKARLNGRAVTEAEWNRAIGGVKRAASGQQKYGNVIPVPALEV